MGVWGNFLKSYADMNAGFSPGEDNIGHSKCGCWDSTWDDWGDFF